jgi:hypothetical protein
MDDMNRLGDLILKHWRTHRPGLIEELVRANQLEPVLRQAQEQTGDLLFSSNSSTLLLLSIPESSHPGLSRGAKLDDRSGPN